MGLQEIYFNWMSERVFKNPRDIEQYSYLLDALNASMFYFSIPMDENRMQDGIDLRYRFAFEKGYSNQEVEVELSNNRSCSMLEMMVALSIKGDERILYDYETGGRADYIFMIMLQSLEFDNMTDDRFDPGFIDEKIDSLLNHRYNYNGYGGLFVVENPRRDMREVDIWYQMNWYIQALYNKNKRRN